MVLSDSEATDTLYDLHTSGTLLVLDGGLTQVRYVGPADHSVLFYSQDRREVLRIDRPVSAGMDSASIVITTYGEGRVRRRRREIVVGTERLSVAERDGIDARLRHSASWDGARRLPGNLQSAISRLAANIPPDLPAFSDAVMSDGQIWLQLNTQRKGPHREWLVVNRDLTPVALARVPAEVIQMSVLDGEAWWVTMAGELGTRYVGRLRLIKPGAQGGAS